MKPGVVNTGSVAVPRPQESSALWRPVTTHTSSCLQVQEQLALGDTKTGHTLSDPSEVIPGLLSAQTLYPRGAEGSTLVGSLLSSL